MGEGTGRSPWRATLGEALEVKDLAKLASIPKTDLHCHAFLSAPLDTYVALLGRPLPEVPRVFGDFHTFAGYIATNLLPAIIDARALPILIRAAFERMAADGVVYSEMSFDLLAPEYAGIAIEEFAEMIAVERDRIAERLTVAPEIGISRALPPDEIRPRLKRWIASGVCRGIDLYDDENLGVLRDFAPLYRLAQEKGLKLKAHAGELCGPESVRDSVETLNLHAVQHGVRAAEDPAVVALLAERGTVLHICPTSNHSLGVCDSLPAHPAKRLVEQGVRITVNTDDFTLFGANVSDEIVNLEHMGFTHDEIAQVIQNGLDEIPIERG